MTYQVPPCRLPESPKPQEVVKNPAAMPKVDIVTTGARSLAYINGHRVNGILDVKILVERGEVTPQIVLTLHADEIVLRTVSSDEFRRLADA